MGHTFFLNFLGPIFAKIEQICVVYLFYYNAKIFWSIKMNSVWFCYYYNRFLIIISIVTTTSLNCYKVFLWFYCVDTKIVFLCSWFLVCVNSCQLLFELIILELWLIVWVGILISVPIFCLSDFTMSVIVYGGIYSSSVFVFYSLFNFK